MNTGDSEDLHGMESQTDLDSTKKQQHYYSIPHVQNAIAASSRCICGMPGKKKKKTKYKFPQREASPPLRIPNAPVMRCGKNSTAMTEV